MVFEQLQKETIFKSFAIFHLFQWKIKEIALEKITSILFALRTVVISDLKLKIELANLIIKK